MEAVHDLPVCFAAAVVLLVVVEEQMFHHQLNLRQIHYLASHYLDDLFDVLHQDDCHLADYTEHDGHVYF